MIRVLVASHHPVMRAGLAATIGSLDDIEVVAVVAAGRAAVIAAKTVSNLVSRALTRLQVQTGCMQQSSPAIPASGAARSDPR